MEGVNLMKTAAKQENNGKYAGILLPVFSLPTEFGIGDFGDSSKIFIDRLANAKQTIWSVLPHTSTGFGNSPYQPNSAFAGNPYFISPEKLAQDGLLTSHSLSKIHFKNLSGDIDYGDLHNKRYNMLEIAYRNWLSQKAEHTPNFLIFQTKNRFWLDDYALFMSIKRDFNFQSWDTWPDSLKFKKASAIAAYKKQNADKIMFWRFVQYMFFKQWKEVKEYANAKGIKVMGDLPFYIGHDSVDAWSNSSIFYISKDKKVLRHSGVPGEHGENIVWGNPCYNWSNMAKNNHQWYSNRFKQMCDMYDIVRIDHANGLVRYFAVPQDRVSPGEWYNGPEFKESVVTKKMDEIAKKTKTQIVLEDMGGNTDRSRELFQSLGWNKTRVIQFTFSWRYGFNDMHLPENYDSKMAVYTGTHDNETIEGILSRKGKSDFKGFMNYLHVYRPEQFRWAVIKKLYMSSASKVIIPMQDVLGLDNRAITCDRGSFENSWRWRLKSMDDFAPPLQRKLSTLVQSSHRAYPHSLIKEQNEKQR